MSKRLFILLTSFVMVLGLVCNARGQGVDGLLLIEYWNNIGGTAAEDLYNNAAYPDSPDEQDILTLFDRPYDRPAPNNDNYGARIRGYLHPPETGDYTFWVASDDDSDLFLSTNDDPANAVLIAEINGWCPAYDWDNTAGSDNPNQVSAPVTLEGGQTYYIEAVYKEGGGGDGIAVAWQGPGIAERAVISGDYLSSVPLPAHLLVTRAPNPADGAIDADTASLEWGAGPTAVSYKVYLSADATIEESELVAETDLTIHLTTLDDGAAYYWRVDAVDADGTVYEGDVWSFTTLPLEAHFPSPADGAKGVESGTTLSWTAGKGVIMHDVYFGTDEAAVAAGDPSTFKGKVMVTSYDPGPLELFTTYYWKIDEFSVTGTNPGPVWSFSAPGYIVITSDEVTLDYDNTAEPFVSELALDVPADLRFGGVADLTLRFQGKAPSGVIYDEATGTYTITGGGHDIWDNADDFHFGYRELTGDATIVARVVDNGTGSNAWAKGGVMIRQSIDAGSAHSFMPLTGGDGNGASFQGRPVADGGSINSDSGEAVAPPYWVKLERVGNDFTGSISPDGVTWTQLGGVNTVEMTDPVLIGLAVTSHQTGELRTFTFDNVDIVGDISADTMSQDIGDDPGGNAPAPVYVALEDSTGAVASVTHGNPAATNIETWRDWTIPLDKFAGVDATSAAKLYIGVGDGQPGGTGSITVDDVFVVKPAGAANIILVSGNHDFDADGVVDDFLLRDILVAEGHMVDYQPGNWTELDDAKIAALNAADLVIISRCSNSGDYAADDTEIAQWNSITTPMINSSTHLLRSSRWKWVDSTSILTLAPAMMELADGTQVDAIDEAEGQSSFIDAAPGNGTVLATGDGLPWIIEWEAGVEYYDGAGQTAGGPRVFFTAGTQETEGVSNWGEWNLTPEGLEVFLATVNRLLPAVEKDVTVPGDIVKGVPDDGDWPGNEHPALAIDDNVSTKYLHFKGAAVSTGIKITPLDGPSVVTGLTFTTANDDYGRDPIAFELSGSNGSIDGPYELIASGDIVDFAQETLWPRFTKNETPIMFDNDVSYKHYQITFQVGRANNDGLMQIAEIELIGTPAPTPADVTAPGDAIQGVPNDGDWPGAETPDLAIDDNTATKYLHFKGDFDPDPGTGGTGFQVTPSMGSSIVTGLTLTTANDVPGRDPISFELSGSNDSIDGPYELIASGDVVDFAQEAEWPRFTMNATPISFENDKAYAHYQLILTAIRGPVGGSVNSMQIAEVELIGLPAAPAPSGYVYEGDTLDETWDHDNGSDAWDDTGPGEGNPGGAALLTEDGITFLRIQDTGDPRSLGISDPSNRKVYLTRLTDISLDGLSLEVRMRVATTPPLDNQISGDPWPAEGIGYHIRDGGKGMIGVSDGVGIISFSLAQAGEPMFEDVTTDVLIMNNLVGTEPTSDVDTDNAAAAVALNMMVVDDATQWNTFVIDIVAGGAGTHVVTVSANGGPAESFDVTLGSDLEADAPFITIGSSGTGGITAFDVDYLIVQ